MLFTLQKFIWYLAAVPSCLFIVIASGLVLSRRRRTIGRAMVLAGLLLLYLLSLDSVANLLLLPLENAAPPVHGVPQGVSAVVVPGGGSVDLRPLGAAPVPNAETWTRLVKGIELARQLQVPLVLCGGSGEPFATALSDADVMATAARSLGFPATQTIVENRSRNTLENSHAVRALVKGDRIVLATSAYYMKRAMAMFQRRGFTVIPAPTYHLVQAGEPSLFSLIPGAVNLARSNVAWAEWLSLAWWGLRGEL
jgi:uncharacterized SAM-binding protein YcdF (DUF218 family)